MTVCSNMHLEQTRPLVQHLSNMRATVVGGCCTPHFPRVPNECSRGQGRGVMQVVVYMFSLLLLLVAIGMAITCLYDQGQAYHCVRDGDIYARLQTRKDTNEHV